ncbi:Hypothetical protein ORPV_534 [Orpheovirus IHUMI-LCC2]|uniref:Uncharacterized protein n=1 Tax=Orpheovirus IHUMI-LCC2 TaxID=2023057 RepID=A0A2I2L4H7_9VIRU|nr:Hypothetical protein ORPV_534 [Orpheovirus IHUMI-LCC2]SNW62438.1 Hypothetical protein ORPV_534 [Orpheovirus IHUMI-LCC2]
MINWNYTNNIFGDLDTIVNDLDSIPHYVDKDVHDVVNPSNFFDIIYEIDKFKGDKYTYKCCKIVVEGDEDYGMRREWIGKDGKLQYWIYEDGYAVIWELGSKFLILGNGGCHPFIVTNTFQFYNTDGSTFEDIDFPSLTLDGIKELTKSKLFTYIFSQMH